MRSGVRGQLLRGYLIVLRDARVLRPGPYGSSLNSLVGGPELPGHCHGRCRADNALSAVRADDSSAQSRPHGRVLPALPRAREASGSPYAFRHVGLRNRVRAAVAPRRQPCQLILGAPFRPLGTKRKPGSVSARSRAGLPGARPAGTRPRTPSGEFDIVPTAVLGLRMHHRGVVLDRLSAALRPGVTLLGDADRAPRG